MGLDYLWAIFPHKRGVVSTCLMRSSRRGTFQNLSIRECHLVGPQTTAFSVVVLALWNITAPKIRLALTLLVFCSVTPQKPAFVAEPGVQGGWLSPSLGYVDCVLGFMSASIFVTYCFSMLILSLFSVSHAESYV